MATERQPASTYCYSSRASTLGTPILETYPRQRRNLFLFDRDTRVGPHGADSLSATHVFGTDPNAPFDGSRRLRNIGLLPSHAFTPHAETEQSRRARVDLLCHVQRLLGPCNLGRLSSAPSTPAPPSTTAVQH